VEYARNVLNLPEADHEESAPDASTLVIHRLTCSLVGQTQTIQLTRGSRVHRAYRREEAAEQFRCNFGLNPSYRELVAGEPLRVAGTDREGEVRVVELMNHCFFVATLFLPQLPPSPETPHPLIVAYLRAAVAFQDSRTGGTNQGKAATEPCT
jgi:CTP synthase (UTP-ammonia lyase)